MTSTATQPTMRSVNRFIDAQRTKYPQALREIQQGRKRTHWMWYVFPQLAALGKSETARYFGISGRDEAVAYLDHPVLRTRLFECTTAALRHDQLMFDWPDNHKLRSSMTLFSQVVADATLPNAVLAKFFDGEPDQLTLDVLAGKEITLPPSRYATQPLWRGDMGKHWDKGLSRAREAVAAVGARREVEPWRRERVNAFIRGYGLSTVAQRQIVDAWLADQARARREGWEAGHDEGTEDAWNQAQ